MIQVYLGLGGNQGDVPAALSHALHELDALPDSQVAAWSRPWHTPPWGETHQAAFLNLAVELHTGLAPLPLLNAILRIERRLGRVRQGPRWGPRRIDTDILLYGQRIIRHPRLHVPHPLMHQRAFVLCPLLELAPEIQIPQRGPARQWLRQLDTHNHRAADFTLTPRLKESSSA